MKDLSVSPAFLNVPIANLQGSFSNPDHSFAATVISSKLPPHPLPLSSPFSSVLVKAVCTPPPVLLSWLPTALATITNDPVIYSKDYCGFSWIFL